MMGFIEDQKRSAAKCAEPVPQGPHVHFADQQPMRNEETRVRGPGIHAEPTFAPDALHVLLVEDLEGESKPVLELVLPLEQHGWRTRNDDLANLLPDQQLARDQAGFNSFPKANVISDEEIDAWKAQRLSQR